MRLILGLAIWVGTLFPAVAAAQETDLVATRDALRDAIYARDIERVETLLSDMQARIKAGADTHESMRYLYQVFATTHPDTIDFVKHWNQIDLSSAYAMAALGRSHRLTGWNMRGGAYNHQTYPDALYQGNALLNEGFRLAHSAFREDPSLAPASDLVLDLARSARQQQIALEVGEAVMQDRPDWGTLRRLLPLSRPNYGGTFELGKALCDYFGPMLSEPQDDMVRWCLMTLAYFYHMDRLQAEYDVWMNDPTQPQPERPLLQYLIYRQSNGHELTQEQVDWMERYLRDGRTTDYHIARSYDMSIAGPQGRDLMEQVVLKRAKAAARDMLVHDPYNLWALDTLRQYSMIVTKGEDGRVSMVPDHEATATDQERAEYGRLRLLAAPYKPALWEQYVFDLDSVYSYENGIEAYLTIGDRALINAIVYSNHGARWVQRLYQRKLGQYQQLQIFDEQGVLNHMGVKYEDIDITGLVICPMIRARMLMDLISEAENGYPAQFSSIIEEREYRRFHAEAEQAGACSDVIGAPPEGLIYQPVPLEQLTELSAPQPPG